MRIDHVTVAAAALDPLREAFAAIELTTDYGGAHSNGVTHMALLGFDDGSYVELISTLAPGARAPWWGAQLAADAGPAAWAVEVPDVAAEAARLAALGIPTTTPRHMTRARPDGTLVEWDLAFVGDGEPGATLPFIIRDCTPRRLRVRPSASVAGTELRGVGGVVLAVADADAVAARFRRAYGWPAPAWDEDDAFGARLAHFAGTPVFLAMPLAAGSWMAERVVRFGDAPCAFLLDTRDDGATTARLPLGASRHWFGARVRWIDPARIGGIHLGVVSAS